MKETQITNTILLVRPANFGYNVETAENNVFQNAETHLTAQEIKDKAIHEFDLMAASLRQHGVHVIIIQDTNEPLKTDAVFPNNWLSTHANGKVYLFPMFSVNRRLERRVDIISTLRKHFDIEIDTSLLRFEYENKYLESTGSMILDRPSRLIYACYSIRTNKVALEEFGRKIGYEVIGFDATDANGIPYYHTNVIMTLCEHIAIICTASIENSIQRKNVLKYLEMTNKVVIELSRDQINQFAGNMLEVKVEGDKNLLVMSSAAFNSLKEEQLNIIKKYNKIVSLDLETIEKFGGGSARCMMAEIFLPRDN